MSFNFARYSQWFRWFRVHTTSINPNLLRRGKTISRWCKISENSGKKEYLTSLRGQNSSQRNKLFSEETIAVGKIVLIHDETPRNQWKLGLITQLHQGEDGFTRSVTLRTANRNHISSPIENLYLIDMSGDRVELKDSQQKENEEENIPRTRRTPRAAAPEASKRIKAHSEY